MNKKTIAMTLVIIAAAFGFWLTRPASVEKGEGSMAGHQRDPSSFPKAVHMAEHHGITFGASESADVYVSREGEKIRIEIRPRLLKSLPDTFLSTLGWETPANRVSDEGYREFLDALDLVYHQEEESHGGEDHNHPGEADTGEVRGSR